MRDLQMSRKKRFLRLVLCGLIGVGFFCLSFNCTTQVEYFTFDTNDMANTFKYGQSVEISTNVQYLRNEILVFKQNDSIAGYPLSGKAALRLVGLPGDRLVISNGVVFVNDKKWGVNSDKKHGYIINITGFADYNATVSFLRPYSGYPLNNDYALINLDALEYKAVSATASVIPFSNFSTDTMSDTILIKKVNILRMQKDSMSEMVIPKKGDTITITDGNRKYYRHSINDFIPIGNGKYIVNHNMYFMIGDNWMEATDSRYYGLINERDVIGSLKE